MVAAGGRPLALAGAVPDNPHSPARRSDVWNNAHAWLAGRSGWRVWNWPKQPQSMPGLHRVGSGRVTAGSFRDLIPSWAFQAGHSNFGPPRPMHARQARTPVKRGRLCMGIQRAEPDARQIR